MNVIVFGSDCSNSLGLVQCLGKEIVNVSALIFGEKTGIVESSKYCNHCTYFADVKECINFLYLDTTSFLDGSTIVIPSSDISAFYLNCHVDDLSKKILFEHCNVNSTFNYQELLDKQVQLFLAEKAKLDVPKLYRTIVLPTTFSNDDGIVYPCIIKPTISKDGCKGDLRICYCFQDIIENISSLHCSHSIIIEQYIDRDFEISILGVALSNGDIIMPAIEEKLSLFPKYTGLECLAKIKKFESCVFKKTLSEFVKSLGYIGLFSIEMMHNKQDGKFYFTEINLRNDGANSFILKCGVNLPFIHACDLLGQDIDSLRREVIDSKCGYYIWDIHHFKSFLHKDMSFIQWLSEILKSRGFLTFFVNDPSPFFKQYYNWILRKLRKNDYYPHSQP